MKQDDCQMVKKILEQIALSQEFKPLYIEHHCYLKSETEQDEKMWEYIKKLNYAVEYNRYIDYNSGKRIMYDIIEDYKNKKRLMYDVIDNNKKPLREMVMYVSSEGMKNDSRDF